MASSRNLVSTIGALASPKMGDGTRCPDDFLILLQLIQVLTPGSNLINFYEDQKEVGERASISHK